MAIIFIIPLLLLLGFLLYRKKREQNYHKKHQLVRQYLHEHYQDKLIFSKQHITVAADLVKINGFFKMQCCDVFVYPDFLVLLGFNQASFHKLTECPPVIISAQNHPELQSMKLWAEIVQPEKIAFNGTDTSELTLHYIVPNRPEYQLKGQGQFFDPFCRCILKNFTVEEYKKLAFIQSWQKK